MAKHIADQPRDRAEGARVREYTRIQRAENPSSAALDLQRRAAERVPGRRAQEFLRRDGQQVD